jgi:hypothetical protein
MPPSTYPFDRNWYNSFLNKAHKGPKKCGKDPLNKIHWYGPEYKEQKKKMRNNVTTQLYV